jgi:hypothetical protein
VQSFTWAHTVDAAQSAEEPAMQAPFFAVQLPSSLQRADFRQSALPSAVHLPSLALH